MYACETDAISLKMKNFNSSLLAQRKVKCMVALLKPLCNIIVDKIPLKLAKVNHADVTTKYV